MRCDTLWITCRLATLDPTRPGLGIVERGVVAARDGRIVYAGSADEAPAFEAAQTIDCDGRWITPGLIDPHTHLVFAGDRAHEFELRLAGATYEEIAKAGGGIVSTMRCDPRSRRTTWSQAALPRLDALIAEGVTTVEIKSGYGLSLDDEIKSLRAARVLGDIRRVDRQHHLPRRARPAAGISRRQGCFRRSCLREDDLPAIAAEGLADAVDGFCEGIAFSPAQIRRVFEAARDHGLPVKLHADQLSNLTAPRWPPLRRPVGRPPGIPDEAGIGSHGRARHCRDDAARRLLLHPRAQGAADRGCCAGRRADGPRHRLQSRHLAPDLAAAGHEHGRDPVPA
jgi:imidazolonepropionase